MIVESTNRIKCNSLHETCVIWYLNILHAFHSLMWCFTSVTLASYRQVYYGMSDWGSERFHNMLKAISSTKLG